jgi:hypothetical protein
MEVLRNSKNETGTGRPRQRTAGLLAGATGTAARQTALQGTGLTVLLHPPALAMERGQAFLASTGAGP